MGKADDDIWVHLPATAAHLRGSLAALAEKMVYVQCTGIMLRITSMKPVKCLSGTAKKHT